MIHPARILKIRVRGLKRDLSYGSSYEEVSIVMPGVIARIEGSDIQVLTAILYYEFVFENYCRFRLLCCSFRH